MTNQYERRPDDVDHGGPGAPVSSPGLVTLTEVVRSQDVTIRNLQERTTVLERKLNRALSDIALLGQLNRPRQM